MLGWLRPGLVPKHGRAALHNLRVRERQQALPEVAPGVPAVELLQLEGERAQFQTQIQALSRQVDSIARNERLIGLLEKRNRTIEECSNYDVSTLDQLTGRLSEIRSRQEAELDMLSSHQGRTDYEDLARMELNSATTLVTIEAEPHVTVLMPAGN